MKKDYFFAFVSAITIASAFSFVGDNNSVQKSDGGPPYNTNAPLEKTCSGSESGSACHSGSIADNSGPGTPDILFSGGSVYVPGQTYTVTARITHPTRNRFGFQIVSLADNTNLFTGSILVSDTVNTRSQQPTWGPAQDRIYMMHRLAGSYPNTPNTGSWSYTWTAPSTNVGNISFYACFLSANNNNVNDSGDETYWKKITITPSAVGIEENISIEGGVKCFPNPASEFIHLIFNASVPSLLRADLLDMNGNVVQTLLEETVIVSTCITDVKLANHIGRGAYLLRTVVNGRLHMQKLQIN